MKACKHCWHHDAHLAALAPSRVCCQCGRKEIEMELPEHPDGHGPYAPKKLVKQWVGR